MYSNIISKRIYESNPESVDTNNIIFESEKPKHTNIPTYADYAEGSIQIFILLFNCFAL